MLDYIVALVVSGENFGEQQHLSNSDYVLLVIDALKLHCAFLHRVLSFVADWHQSIELIQPHAATSDRDQTSLFLKNCLYSRHKLSRELDHWKTLVSHRSCFN